MSFLFLKSVALESIIHRIKKKSRCEICSFVISFVLQCVADDAVAQDENAEGNAVIAKGDKTVALDKVNKESDGKHRNHKCHHTSYKEDPPSKGRHSDVIL